jgi:RND family efflux transporter MFP subunit
MPHLPPPARPPLGALAAPPWESVKLGVATLSHAQWSHPISASVRVDDSKAVRLGAPARGRVDRVFVERGQSVTQGDPLFSLTSAELGTLAREVLGTRSALAAARAQHQRVQALVAAHALAGKESAASAMALRQAVLAYATAQAKLGALGVTAGPADEFVVKAPRSGVVVDKNVLPGQAIAQAADADLLTIADLSSVLVVADAFAADAADVEAGTEAQIEIATSPGHFIDAKVELATQVLDPARRTVPVRIRLENPRGELKPNSYARVQFLLARAPGAVEVPNSAILTDGQQAYLYVRDAKGRFSRRDVVTGPSRSGRAIILSGLRAGETVAETGSTLLDNQLALLR